MAALLRCHVYHLFSPHCGDRETFDRASIKLSADAVNCHPNMPLDSYDESLISESQFPGQLDCKEWGFVPNLPPIKCLS